MSYYDNLMLHNSGLIQIQVPSYSNHDALPSQYVDNITGILQEDPSIQMGNTFTPLSELSEALGEIQNTQMVLGANNLLNYIPASAMTWQGTAPIKINVSFYLVTLSEKSNIQKTLKKLAELATVHVVDETSSRIHGGYRFMNYEVTNEKSLISNEGIDKCKEVPGTCRIFINDSTCLQGMLLQNLQYQPSTVVCRHGEPLYYIVNAQFQQYRPPVDSDLNSVFGG